MSLTNDEYNAIQFFFRRSLPSETQFNLVTLAIQNSARVKLLPLLKRKLLVYSGRSDLKQSQMCLKDHKRC